MTDSTTLTTPRLREKSRLMSASEIERTLVRLAHEIVEKNDGGKNLGLIGIKRRGVPLAQRIGALIATIEKHPVDTGVLDISFYRDDLSTAGPRPTVTPGAIGFDVNGRDIVLMDDVLYTGRTIRAALDALFDHGRPSASSSSSSSTAATASSPSRPPTPAAPSPPPNARSSKSNSTKSTSRNKSS